MKKVIVGILGLIWLVTVSAASLKPETVEALMVSKGTSYVLETYFSCDEPSKATGLDMVKTGFQDWLRIAARLVKESDGCYVMGLQTSITLALIKNPEKVLDLVDSGNRLEAAYICVPFMADEVDPRILREQLKVLDSLERALKQVKDKKLEGKKQRCLSYVRTAKKDTIDELKAPGSK